MPTTTTAPEAIQAQVEIVTQAVTDLCGTTRTMLEQITELVTLAHEHGDLQLKGSNESWSEEDCERDDELSQHLLPDLAWMLPDYGGEPFRVRLEGDPRGATVFLLHGALPGGELVLDGGRLG